MFVDGNHNWDTELVSIAYVFAQVAKTFAKKFQIFLKAFQCDINHLKITPSSNGSLINVVITRFVV